NDASATRAQKEMRKSFMGSLCGYYSQFPATLVPAGPGTLSIPWVVDSKATGPLHCAGELTPAGMRAGSSGQGITFFRYDGRAGAARDSVGRHKVCHPPAGDEAKQGAL